MKSVLNLVKSIREKNLCRYGALKAVMVFAFPVILTLMTETAHLNSPAALCRFIAAKPGIIVFDVLIVSFIYAAVLFISRHAFFSAALCSFLFFMFSAIEFFKYESNGMHFDIADIFMTSDLGKIASFAPIRPTSGLVMALVCLILYTVALFLLNIKLPVRKRIGAISGICALIVFTGMFAFKPVYKVIYSFFEINNEKDVNIFTTEEKFDNNMLIAGITESISRQFDSILLPPDDYSSEAVGKILNIAANNSENIPNSSALQEKADVIVVMCEAFCDMRRVNGIEVPNGVYDGFDYVADSANAYSGRAVVPAFCNGTARTEFELLFGLPVKSLNNPFIPHTLLRLDGVTKETFAKYYREAGYSTAYVHPFVRNFYNRGRTYEEYGFDRLVFMDDFDIATNMKNGYIDDASVFRQILSMLDKSDAPMYIHATTMQNHKPYDIEGYDGTEQEYYLDLVRTTSAALKDFYDELSKRDRPAIVLFVGDHLPYFGVEDDIYRQAGFTADNCGELYEQSFLIFANYAADYGAMPQSTVSAFYLPHLLNALSGVSGTGDFAAEDFVDAMLVKMNAIPVYADTNEVIANDAELDMLTYDRTLGEKYSD